MCDDDQAHDVQVEDDGHRGGDSELSRLRAFWPHVVALAIIDQDEAWIRGIVAGCNLILEAAGIEPGCWDRVMRPLADAIRAERRLAEHERRPRKPILLGEIGRKRLRHSGLRAH